MKSSKHQKSVIQLLIFLFIKEFSKSIFLPFYLQIQFGYSSKQQFDKQKMKRSLTKSMLLQTNCKENEIECLKQEVYQLKDLQYDIFRLNDEIAVIQAKYNMVLDEKDRNQVLLKTKMNITKQNLQELQSDVEVMKSQVTQANLNIQNIVRDNATLQKSCDNKQNQILSLTVAIKEMQRTNENKLMDLKTTEQALQRIKQHKSKMQDQCDKLCKRLNENKQAYKQLQRETKNQMIVQKSLNSTLENMRQEGDNLLTQMKIRENVLKETSLQYDNLCQQVKQAVQCNDKLNRQCKNSQDNYNRLTRNLELGQKANEQKTGKLRQIENCVFKYEQQLSKTVIKRDGLMKQHSDLATKNKDLNLEIDDCLMRILQLENVNKALQKNIEEYIACDEQARYLLDRKQKMTELLQTVGVKLSKTESAIAHLM